jgi:hypothetical protein
LNCTKIATPALERFWLGFLNDLLAGGREMDALARDGRSVTVAEPQPTQSIALNPWSRGILGKLIPLWREALPVLAHSMAGHYDLVG